MGWTDEEQTHSDDEQKTENIAKQGWNCSVLKKDFTEKNGNFVISLSSSYEFIMCLWKDLIWLLIRARRWNYIIWADIVIWYHFHSKWWNLFKKIIYLLFITVYALTWILRNKKIGLILDQFAYKQSHDQLHFERLKIKIFKTLFLCVFSTGNSNYIRDSFFECHKIMTEFTFFNYVFFSFNVPLLCLIQVSHLALDI